MKTDSGKAVDALLAVLRKTCAALPGAEEYVMVHHPAFRVGKKPFAIAGMEEASRGATVSVNLGAEAQPELLDDPRFTRTPYIGQHGWVTVAHEVLKKGELETLVVDSYLRVATGRNAPLWRAPRHRAAPRDAAEREHAERSLYPLMRSLWTLPVWMSTPVSSTK